MPLNTFAKKLGFKSAKAYGFKGHLHVLERQGALLVKQAGYLADSLHHPKVVVVKNWEAVELHFGSPGLSGKGNLPRWRRARKCKHKDFTIVAVLDELEVHGRTIRRVMLKCGLCEFYLRGIQIDGVMKEARPLA